jgi:hypothetical protein
MAELKAYLDARFVLEATVTGLMNLTPAPADEDDEGGVHVVPFDIRQWLARLRLLEGIPFAYLAADSELLPRESIRFFYLDRRWTDALVQGALGVGTVSSADRAQLEQLYDVIRAEVDDEEHRVRPVGGEGATSTSQTITGFLLRSRAVSGWPGLHVRAYDRELAEGDNAVIPEGDARRLRLLRMERLAPAVLLVLFDGVPQIVHIEEPRRGIQFGVRLDSDPDGVTFSPWIPPRDATDPQKDIADKVDVPCRPGSPGVLDFRHLNKKLLDRPDTHMSGDGVVDSAEFALEAIRFPYRQVFGDTAHPVEELLDVFRPTVFIAAQPHEKTVALTERFTAGLE